MTKEGIKEQDSNKIFFILGIIYPASSSRHLSYNQLLIPFQIVLTFIRMLFVCAGRSEVRSVPPAE